MSDDMDAAEFLEMIVREIVRQRRQIAYLLQRLERQDMIRLSPLITQLELCNDESETVDQSETDAQPSVAPQNTLEITRPMWGW